MRARLLSSAPVDVTVGYAYQVSVHATRRRADRAAVYDGIWEDAARGVGATYRREGERAVIERGGGRTVVHATATTLDGPEVLALALDKAASRVRLVDAGIPVASQLAFSALDPRPAIDFLAAARSRCVVKPAAGAGGDGVTAGVTTRGELLLAIAWAARFAGRLVIEQQVDGSVYRALVLDGEPVAVIKRNRPAVLGDGRSRIGELIVTENNRRLARHGRDGLSLLHLDLDLAGSLANRGLRLRSVPQAGSRVELKTSTSEAGSSDTETVPTGEWGRIAGIAAAAAGAIGLRLAGVDVVTTADAIGTGEAGATVIEVNGAPGLHFHYQVRDPATVQRVAVPVLETLLR